MKINLKLKHLDQSSYVQEEWSLKRKIEIAKENIQTGRDVNALEGTVTIDISNLKPLVLENLKQHLLEVKKTTSQDPLLNTMINKIDKFLSIIKDPNSQIIKTIEALKTAIDSAIQKSKNKWFFVVGSDERILPWAIESIEQKSHREDDTYVKYVSIKLKASISPFLSDRTLEKNITIYKDDFDEEDYTLSKLLQAKGIYLEDQQSIVDYKESFERFLKMYRPQLQGKVYTTEDKGVAINEKDDSYWSRYYEKWEYLSNSSFKHKLVIDYGDLQHKLDDNSFLNSGNPVHPYLPVFNLFDHKRYKIHCDNLDEYVFDKKIGNNLIINDFDKSLLTKLLTNEKVSKDIIEGKSGGTIIMAYGPPGVGKTLTAEVMSEMLEKPLYKVQASQLGISPEEIEKKLGTILRRSERINAILLIDEADTYIRSRGNDIVQNNIVGAFLRLMEYYKGIMFLTTNLADSVDQAILSRCMLKIKYDFLDNMATGKVFRIQEKINSIPYSDVDQINLFYDEYNKEKLGDFGNNYSMVSGRYIKNMLKVYSLIFPDQPFNLTNYNTIKKYI